jgi:hypothetical protein
VLRLKGFEEVGVVDPIHYRVSERKDFPSSSPSPK